jgi:ornithine cyclodeaminase
MTRVIELEQIKAILQTLDLVPLMEEGFVAYSAGRVVVPPVGEMIFEDPPGEVHIKYGYIKGDDYYVIKIASGFYENRQRGLPGNNGLILVFDQKTGEPRTILMDEGHLTDVRTAAAGAVAAKYLAPRNVRRVGILGTGVQGRLQLEYLGRVVACRDAVVWGRSQGQLDAYRAEMEPRGFRIQTTLAPEEVAAQCNLIVTCTPSKVPLLSVDQIRKGTHITAMGSDTSEKQELDPRILARADRVVADSISQVMVRGESFKAMTAGLIGKEKLVELGSVIARPELRRASDEEITVADLTGVAVQDIQIAKAVLRGLS